MKTEVKDTFWCKIYIAGPRLIAEQLLREECWSEGLCITIEDTKFIYTGGEETGYVVGFINYPRFPKSEKSILERALNIAKNLIEKTGQSSCSVVTPEETYWLSRREDESKA